jgi:immunoglobulin-binding protein 1
MITETILDSVDDMHIVFDRVDKSLLNEDTAEEAVKDANLMPTLKALEKYLQGEAIFSPNEEFEDLDLGLIKFLRLPRMIALAHSKQQGPGCVISLKEAERYYLIYLDLLNHYRILSESISKTVEEYRKLGATFKIDREVKIQLYKEEKGIENEMSLARNKQEWRELAKLGLLKWAYADVNSLLFIPQEMEILNFKRKLETDIEAKRIYEEQRAQPPGKLNYFKIDSTKPDAPIISSNQIQGLESIQENEGVVVDYSHSNTNQKMNQHQEILSKLNQHCYAQPKMTLDEFDALEYSLMKDKEARNAEGARLRKEELAKLGIENSDDSENEIVCDAKRYKERAWDDWKDENEKGAGNRNGR